jgi:hypothetical protein
MWLVWSNNPESIATGRVTKAGQVKSDDPEKKGHPGSSGWGLGVRVTTPTPEKTYVQKTTEMSRTESINRRLPGCKEKEFIEDQELDGRMWFRGMHYNCWR